MLTLAELESRALRVWAARPLWLRAISRLKHEYHFHGRMSEAGYRKVLGVLIDAAPAPSLFDAEGNR